MKLEIWFNLLRARSARGLLGTNVRSHTIQEISWPPETISFSRAFITKVTCPTLMACYLSPTNRQRDTILAAAIFVAWHPTSTIEQVYISNSYYHYCSNNIIPSWSGDFSMISIITSPSEPWTLLFNITNRRCEFINYKLEPISLGRRRMCAKQKAVIPTQ